MLTLSYFNILILLLFTKPMSIKNEASEITRKLQELSSFYKNDPAKAVVREALETFKLACTEDMTVQHALLASKLDRVLMELNSAKRHIYLLELMHLCLIHDLYTCKDICEIISGMAGMSWDLPSKMKILQMSFYFARFNLPLKACFTILAVLIEQFAVEEPSIDLISRSVVCQVIEKILSRYLSGDHQSDDLAFGGPGKLFEFLHKTIVAKGQTFPSYILLIIIKYPNIEAMPDFQVFLRTCFAECCINTLENGKNDDRVPVFEAILKVERSFSSLVSLESIYFSFPDVYTGSPGCETMLRFLVCLFNVRAELERFPYPPRLLETLLRFLKDTDFAKSGSKKFIRFYADIIKGLRIEAGANEFSEIIFDKIGRLTTASEAVDRLYFSVLTYCTRNDLRGLFEKGLILGYMYRANSRVEKREPKGSLEDDSEYSIEDINRFVFDVREYMQSSWYVYFDNNDEWELSRLADFKMPDLVRFIDAIPHGSGIVTAVFDMTSECFNGKHAIDGDESSLVLFEQLLSKISDDRLLFNLILKFYRLNSGLPAEPAPLKFLLARLRGKAADSGRTLMVRAKLNELMSSVDQWIASFHGSQVTADEARFNSSAKLSGALLVSDLCGFISNFLEISDPVRCWDEIFGLIGLIDGQLNSKVEILLHIEASFLASLDKRCLEPLLFTLVETLVDFTLLDTPVDGDVSVGQLYAKTVKALDGFAEHLWGDLEETQLWLRTLLFYAEIINRYPVAAIPGKETEAGQCRLPSEYTSQLSSHFLSSFFTFFSSNSTKMKTSELLLFTEILFKILYELKTRDTTLEMLSHLSGLPAELLVRLRVGDLVGFIANRICEEDAEISASAFEVLKRIAESAKREETHSQPLESSKHPVHSNQQAIPIYSKKPTVIKPKGRKRKNMREDTVQESSIIDFNELNPPKSAMATTIETPGPSSDDAILESKVFQERLPAILISAFDKILSECSPTKCSIIFQVFTEIPSFKFNISSITSLSEHLRKFVEMPDPFRTNAMDCFIKACSNSHPSAYLSA